MDLKQHMEHPFYKEVNQFWHEVQEGQIRKGAEKYPLPFDPDNWTETQLLQHAMQENVDQAHYMYGLYLKIKQRDEIIKRAIEVLKSGEEGNYLHHDLVNELEAVVSSNES